MNLKQRLTNKTTSTVQVISDTQAIYSDEITSNPSCLCIIEAADKAALWTAIQQRAIGDCATQTRFVPIINLITATHHKVINLVTNQVISTKELSC